MRWVDLLTWLSCPSFPFPHWFIITDQIHFQFFHLFGTGIDCGWGPFLGFGSGGWSRGRHLSLETAGLGHSQLMLVVVVSDDESLSMVMMYVRLWLCNKGYLGHTVLKNNMDNGLLVIVYTLCNPSGPVFNSHYNLFFFLILNIK